MDDYMNQDYDELGRQVAEHCRRYWSTNYENKTQTIYFNGVATLHRLGKLDFIDHMNENEFSTLVNKVRDQFYILSETPVFVSDNIDDHVDLLTNAIYSSLVDMQL